MQLSEISSIRIPRCYAPVNAQVVDRQLIGFSKRPVVMVIQVYIPSFAGSFLFLKCQEKNFAAKGDKGRRKKGSSSPSSDH